MPGYDTIQDEGTNLTQRAKLNFIGDSVVAADNSGNTRTDVTISAVKLQNTTPGTQQTGNSNIDGEGIFGGKITAGNSTTWINVVNAHGAKGDGVVASATGSMTNGSATLTMSAATFSSSDVGKYVVVQGAKSGSPSELGTTISGYTSATVVTLAAAATVTVSGAQVTFGTDNTSMLQAALDALPRRGVLYIPGGLYLTGPLVNAKAWSRITGDSYLATVLAPKSNASNSF